MGLGQNSGRATFVNIKDGKLQVKKDQQIETYGHLSGLMVGLEIKDDEYQGKKYKKLSIRLIDEDESFVLDVRVGSGYWIGFCMSLPNIDLKYPITLVPSMKTENNKEKRTMFVSQAGKALKWFWTKDNPGQLPGIKKITFKNEDLWDTDEQNNWLIEYITHQIKPNLPHAAIAGPASDLNKGAIPHAGAASHPGGPKTADDVTEPIDDLPF